jgi:hypothetical protein
LLLRPERRVASSNRSVRADAEDGDEPWPGGASDPRLDRPRRISSALGSSALAVVRATGSSGRVRVEQRGVLEQ